jgi:hypothetical protein
MTMKTSYLSYALVLGTLSVISIGPANAGPFEQCLSSGESRANCACERALRIGTDRALRQFVLNYDAKDTACAATNSTRLIFGSPAVGQGNSNVAGGRFSARQN